MSKEEFNKVWKDTSKKGILNQYYYDYTYLQKLKEDINKAIEYIKHSWWLRLDQVYDTSKDLKGWEVEQLLEILRGKDE